MILGPGYALEGVIPPIEEGCIISCTGLVMLAMPLTPGRPTLWHQLVISPIQVHARMYLHQQPYEYRHEKCTSENVRANDVEREVGQ